MAEILETCWSCGGAGCYRCENGFRRVGVESIFKIKFLKPQQEKISAQRFVNKLGLLKRK